ncbi:hypothetical protein FOA43_003276 [Brettanomyces nanus]|uniref:Uncharacterized protein n=1 Tax=Eeniella nana TaxID=13502 RepID=A0A875RQ49_EENNA|nr:uncharacterized protein FOA43_003276 [Brettanomyces nanus]QPG75890.1 hypothetical protein FOA43_003276 [Brettanomyces nanus]
MSEKLQDDSRSSSGPAFPLHQKDRTLKSSKSEEEDFFYQPIKRPVRGDFNPDRDDIEVPQVIKPELIDNALKKLHMRPMRRKALKERYSLLGGGATNVVTERNYRVLDDLQAFTGNLEDFSSDCEKLSYSIQYNVPEDHKVEHTDPIPLSDKSLLEDITEYLENSGLEENIPSLKDKGKLDPSHWYRLSGSAIWLPDEECYMMVSRIMYAPTKRDAPLISLVRMQLYDNEWKELKGRRIRYHDATDIDADRALRKISVLGTSNKHSAEILDHISVKFPSFMDIPLEVKSKGNMLGPEDPRIIYKPSETGNNEPVVLFNMFSGLRRRSMYAAFPLRKPKSNASHKVTILQFRHSGSSSLTIKAVEKNWVPFFEDTKNPEYISFLYGLDPLVVFRCRLDNGKCDKIQDDGYGTGMIASNKIALRGGTNLMAVPMEIVRQLPELKKDPLHNVKLYVAFAKTHAWKCGCASAFYRPTLYLLVMVDGTYRIDLMTESIDFGLDVLSFDGRSTSCDSSGPNVLTPNKLLAKRSIISHIITTLRITTID